MHPVLGVANSFHFPDIPLASTDARSHRQSMTKSKLAASGMVTVCRAALAMCCLLPSLSPAQVIRCVDKAGNVQFSNMGCPSTTTGRGVDVRPNALDTSGMRQQNQVELAAQQRRGQDEQPILMQQSSASPNGRASECPSSREIRNMEVSVSSPSLKKKERDFFEAEIRRARQCKAGEGNYSAEAWKASKEAFDDQRSVDPEVRRQARARAEGIHSAANPREGDRIAQEKLAEAIREASRRAAAVAAAQDEPRLITRCDKGGCWDNQGGRYNGSGVTLLSATGKTCTRVGNMLQCSP